MIAMGGPGHGGRGHHVGELAIDGAGSAPLDPPGDPSGPGRAQGADGAADHVVVRSTGEVADEDVASMGCDFGRRL